MWKFSSLYNPIQKGLVTYIYMEDLAITLQFFLNCVTKVVGRFGSLLLNLWFDLQMLLDLERGAKTYKFVFYKKTRFFFEISSN